MDESAKPATALPPWLQRWRKHFAANLGVRLERKQEIYLDISHAATLRDSTYWLQILFAAGVATLGLVLNSPAVIIGAMLISPLMGPILAAGLALATGDLVLGLRAGANLLLSCLVAVTFSVLLIGLLPFKEMTAEIAARTQPTTLDLVVALFSGAIGSVATCKELKGVVTSIPGVAIAVALMPPLCVVGYGIGLALSLNPNEGLHVARGGGLLFLTNLVAITFTAMLVFLALHIDVAPVRERVREWRKTDRESAWVRDLLGHYRITDRLGAIGGLPGRLLVVLLPFFLILVPLSKSLGQLKREIAQQQAENRTRRAATELWQQYFTTQPNGEVRSFLDQLSLAETNGKLVLSLRVFDNQPYNENDRKEYARLVATRLNRPADSVQVQLIEIPTAEAALRLRLRETPRLEAPPSVAQLRAKFWQGVQAALQGLRLPPAAQLLDYHIVTSGTAPVRLKLAYLAEREIEPDAQSLITEDIRARLADPALTVGFERVPAVVGPLLFRRNEAVLNAAQVSLVQQVGQLLQAWPSCRLEILTQAEANERPSMAEARAQAIVEQLAATGFVSKDRLTITSSPDSGRGVLLRLVLSPASVPTAP